MMQFVNDERGYNELTQEERVFCDEIWNLVNSERFLDSENLAVMVYFKGPEITKAPNISNFTFAIWDKNEGRPLSEVPGDYTKIYSFSRTQKDLRRKNLIPSIYKIAESTRLIEGTIKGLGDIY